VTRPAFAGRDPVFDVRVTGGRTHRVDRVGTQRRTSQVGVQQHPRRVHDGSEQLERVLLRSPLRVGDDVVGRDEAFARRGDRFACETHAHGMRQRRVERVQDTLDARQRSAPVGGLHDRQVTAPT